MAKIDSCEIKIALAKRHQNREFFLAEVKNGPTKTGLLQFDAVAIYKSWSPIRIRGYEIKTSRSDFLRDNKYSLYLKYFHEFYFVTPKNLVERQEIEPNIGLMWYNPETKQLAVKRKAARQEISINPEMLLYIIMHRLSGDRYPFHNSQAGYWEDWLEKKISNQELNYRVKSALLQEICDKEAELKRQSAGSSSDVKLLEQIIAALRKHHIYGWTDLAERLDQVLTKPYPKELDSIERDLLRSLGLIKELKTRKRE